MVGINQGECGGGPLPSPFPSPTCDFDCPPIVADLKKMGYPTALLSWSENTLILIKLMIWQHWAKFLLPPQALHKTFSLWYCKECCLPFFFFLSMVMTRYNIVTQGSFCVKMKKINFISPKRTKVSQVWWLLIYQKSFEWIKMRGTRNWVKILYLSAAYGYFESDRVKVIESASTQVISVVLD